jgi:ribosomal protein S18 acetylase RimI-like enzyme
VVTPKIRRATEADLEQICDVWYREEVAEEPDPPPNTAGPTFYAHSLRHGELFVSEAAGRIVGFSGSIVRGDVRYLTDLFVLRERQDAGLGRALLAAAMPPDGRVHATLSSRDPRAMALYVRAGMRPWFPHFLIDAPPAVAAGLGRDDVGVIPADPDDPDLVRWDTEIGGRPRAEDLSDLARSRAAVPMWVERVRSRIGYAFVQGSTPGYLRHPEATTIGPVGVRDPEDAAPAVCAVAAWAAARASLLSIGVPGPHAALTPLLEAGGRITYVELFLSSREPFADPRCYVPGDSGAY